MSSYVYSVVEDTLNGFVNINRLTYLEVPDSDIKVALDYISRTEDVLTFVFKDILSAEDKTLLDNLVALHAGAGYREPDVVSISQANPETGALNSTPRYSKPGMLQRIHESEWTTATQGGAIHDKDHNNQDTGWSSVQFYKLDQGVEVLMENPSQEDLDADCIRTDFHWEPDVDYMVLSGELRQKVVPAEDIYFWGLFANVKFPAPGLPVEVLGGGMNLAFNEPLKPFGMVGVSASSLYHDRLQLPDGSFMTEIPDGQGGTIPLTNMGCNRISFVFRHPPGFKHRINAVFGIFR